MTEITNDELRVTILQGFVAVSASHLVIAGILDDMNKLELVGLTRAFTDYGQALGELTPKE